MDKFAIVLILLAASVFADSIQASVLEDPQVNEYLDVEDQTLPVIIYLTDPLDLQILRHELRATFNTLYTEPEIRKQNRKHWFRAQIQERLKNHHRTLRQSIRQIVRSSGFDVTLKRLWSINALAGDVPLTVVREIEELAEVGRVVLDYEIQGPGPSAPPTAANDWNIAAIGAPSLWQLGWDGAGVTIATMDTGADITHADLGPRYRGGSNSWYDPYGENTTPADSSGHGTQVLGIIVGGESGGFQIGVAPGAKFIATKIFNNQNVATTSGIHLAFQWLLDPDGSSLTNDAPDVVNSSWATGSSIDLCDQEFAADLALLEANEIAVVFSAGNYGPQADTSVSPANDPTVLAVGAVDQSFAIDFNSSRGSGACDGGLYPHVVAPGIGVITTDRSPNIYTVASGTSFAVAHLTGAMAILRGAFPSASISQIEASLLNTAVDLGEVGDDHNYGKGLIDVSAAYNWLTVNVGGGGGYPGTIQFASAAFEVSEGTPSLVVNVSREDGSGGDVSVDYSVASNTAIEGEDFGGIDGTLTFADGEVSTSFEVTILDDSVVESVEDFTISLQSPLGGASLGTPSVAVVTISDNDGFYDLDQDDYLSDVDCNDDDPNVFPGAAEVALDGIDQNCDGLDLTIVITRAKYVGAKDQFISWAQSSYGASADLWVQIQLANGSKKNRRMKWNSYKNRWQKITNNYASQFGSHPVSILVFGSEGAVSSVVEQKP